MLKWAKRVGVFLVAGLLALVLAGATFEQWSRASAASRCSPPGTLVEATGSRGG